MMTKKRGYVYKLFKDNKFVGYESWHKTLEQKVYTNLDGSVDFLPISCDSFEVVSLKELTDPNNK